MPIAPLPPPAVPLAPSVPSVPGEPFPATMVTSRSSMLFDPLTRIAYELALEPVASSLFTVMLSSAVATMIASNSTAGLGAVISVVTPGERFHASSKPP